MTEEKKVMTQLLRLIYKAIELENKNRNYGTDVSLSSAEIYCVKIVHDNPGCHVTGAAERAGVSKAALSQMVQRLEKKGIMHKTTSLENKSKYELRLTVLGEKAHTEHMRIEKENRDRIMNIIQAYSKDKLVLLAEFLEKSADSLR